VFLSVDPVLDVKGAMKTPQGWNRYTYVRNNPVHFVDPTGREAIPGELEAFDTSLGPNSVWSSVVKPALRIDTLQEAFSGWGSASANERVLAVAIGALAALEIGSNFLVPEKAPAARAGSVMVGHFPEYLKAGAATGSRVFGVPMKIWNSMTPAAQWIANQTFLDRALARGAEILLSTDPAKVRAGSALAREIQYLVGNGYKIVRDVEPGLWRFERVK